MFYRLLLFTHAITKHVNTFGLILVKFESGKCLVYSLTGLHVLYLDIGWINPGINCEV